MNNQTQHSEVGVQQLYERYASIVHSRCRQFLKSDDDAWDATQDVFMKLMNALSTIEKKESIFSWLMSTSTHHCISVLRKKRGVSFDEEIHAGAEGRSGQERRVVMGEIFRHFLSPWDKKIREVVIYTYIDGYKQEEIARLTGMGESTIRRHLTRFKRKASQSGIKLEDILYG